MKILFACAGGMTSSLLGAELKKHLEKQGYSVTFHGIMSGMDVDRLIAADTDYTIAYMHISGLTVPKRKELVEAFDKILVAPQAKYMLPKVIEVAKEDGVDADHFINVPKKLYNRKDIVGILDLI